MTVNDNQARNRNFTVSSLILKRSECDIAFRIQRILLFVQEIDDTFNCRG